jgi:peroxiredoxin
MCASLRAITLTLLSGLLLGSDFAVPTVHADEAAVSAADFALKALDGRNHRLSEYRGEVVAIVFWASWCGGCRPELVRLQELGGIYGDAGLQVLGVTVDELAEAARAVADSVGAGFPQLVDSTKSVSESYGLKSLPTTVLVDRSGVVRFRYGELDSRGQRAMLGDLRMLLDE